ncbi:MAG TPA: hypothetical protein VH327_02625 [Gammaproteobacteria bacterium]|nr:hypothetical protein [Gammaproteobacteria bacterium]
MQTLPSAPLSASAVVSNGLRLGAGAFSKLFLATTVLALVEFLPNMVMATQFGNDAITPQRRLHVQFGGGQLGLQIGCVMFLLLAQAVTLSRLDHLATRATVDYRIEIRRALKAFLHLFCALLLSILIGIVAMALAGAVGALVGLLGALLLGKAAFFVLLVAVMMFMLLYVFLYLLFVQYSIVLDGSGPIEAINRSFNLVYGHWWHTVAVLLLMVLCVLVAAIIAGIALSPAVLMAGPLDTGRGLFVTSVIQMIGGATLGPFLLAVIYMLYRDLKLRSQPAG